MKGMELYVQLNGFSYYGIVELDNIGDCGEYYNISGGDIDMYVRKDMCKIDYNLGVIDINTSV